MSGDWIVVPKDSWRNEIEVYAKRWDGLTELRNETRVVLDEHFPKIWEISTSMERELDDVGNPPLLKA